MAKPIAPELQNLDRRLNEGFTDAISGRPATSHDHLLARLNDQLIDLRQSWKACRDEATRLRAENAALKADAQRLDYLDRDLGRKFGWRIAGAPAGNLNVQSVIFLASPPVPIRAAIDAAMAGRGART